MPEQESVWPPEIVALIEQLKRHLGYVSVNIHTKEAVLLCRAPHNPFLLYSFRRGTAQLLHGDEKLLKEILTRFEDANNYAVGIPLITMTQSIYSYRQISTFAPGTPLKILKTNRSFLKVSMVNENVLVSTIWLDVADPLRALAVLPKEVEPDPMGAPINLNIRVKPSHTFTDPDMELFECGLSGM